MAVGYSPPAWKHCVAPILVDHGRIGQADGARVVREIESVVQIQVYCCHVKQLIPRGRLWME